MANILRIKRITVTPANILPPSKLVRALCVDTVTGLDVEVVCFVADTDLVDETVIGAAILAANPDVDLAL